MSLTDWINKVHIGHYADLVRAMIEDGIRVQCIVTSPPYYGLRSYLVPDHPNKKYELGLEGTPDHYVANIVSVFEVLKDLLKTDGVVWLNLGDSYREKELIGIPWQSAFALRDAGWHLRSEVIWAKGASGQRVLEDQVLMACLEEGLSQEVAERVVSRLNIFIGNPMPESAKDRVSRSHETIFLLSKSKDYYFDADSIKEEFTSLSEHKKRKVLYKAHGNGETSRGRGDGHNMLGDPTKGRNKRSVWLVQNEKFKGAHFACFPPSLMKPMILAGSKLGDIVFDPFFGSGTVGVVAEKLNRLWMGTELNPDYKEFIEKRRGNSL